MRWPLLIWLVCVMPAAAAVCKGDDPCKACRDCSACWHCSPKNPKGGSCGKVRDQSAAERDKAAKKRAKR